MEGGIDREEKTMRGFGKNCDLRCSFCGKQRSQVGKLIAGPNVYICVECVDLCNEIIGESDLRRAGSGEEKQEADLRQLSDEGKLWESVRELLPSQEAGARLARRFIEQFPGITCPHCGKPLGKRSGEEVVQSEATLEEG